MKNIKILIVICIVFITCKEKALEVQYRYYDTGELDVEAIYNIPNDTTDVTVINYYKNGNIQSRLRFKNGLAEDIGLYHSEDGVLSKLVSYKSGVRHGLQKYYEDGLLYSEILELQGIPICGKRNEGIICGITQINRYRFYDDYNLIIGRYFFDINNKFILDSCSNFHTYSTDTIPFGKESLFGVKFFNLFENTRFSLELGEIDENRNFVDTLNTTRIVAAYDSLVYSYLPVKKGINIILGKVTLKQTDRYVDYVYYHEIYAK